MQRRRIRVWGLALGGTLILLALWPGLASASVTVNTTADSNTGGGCTGSPGDCSLRQAIGAAGPGGTVVVPSGAYTLTFGPLSISQGVTIQGAGARTTSVTLTGGGGSNAFSVGSASPVTISGLTISAGHLTGSSFFSGGAVFNAAGSVLSLVADTIAGTTLEKTDTTNSPVRGAGIHNRGTLTLKDSTVSGNSEITIGAGNVNQGAGLFNSGGTVSISNSTITGNSQSASMGASSRGAGIENLGTQIDLQNVTIAGNTGSANVDTIATINARNTIVANDPEGNCSGALTSQGHNLESADQCGFHAAGDETGKDPLLGPLANKGGPTDTEPLLAGSPAIDQGDPAGCPSTDQRGFPRPRGPVCDIGAFEFSSNAFTLGKLKRNTRKGTAILTVTVPGPGTLALGGSGVKSSAAPDAAVIARDVSAAGKVKLKIRSRGRKRSTLNRTGRVKLRTTVTYTPTGGDPASQVKKIKLIKR